MLSKNLQEISSQTSEICKFYAGKTLFITGAAGFLGSVLLESLLRCCPDISKIYILLRPKKDVQVEDRKNLIFKKDIFIKLKATNPDVLNKVVAVSGDTSQENLGLSENDFNNLTKEVSVVFHAAATISFTKPLSFTIRHNVIGTKNIIDFCRKTENLKVLVYTSSAFSNSNQKDVIEEKLYDLPFSSEEILKYGRNDNDDELINLYEMCNPPFPNYYTFSKCVAENLFKETASDLPVCIIRPSIIFCCLKGPLPGYIENGSAIVNLNLAVGRGYIRVVSVDKHKKLEIIPVDVVANSHIVGAFHHVSHSLASPSVFNCVSGKDSVILWSEYMEAMITVPRKNPLPQSFLYPTMISCTNPKLYSFLSLLLHYLPAAVFDLLLWISGSKFRVLKLYKVYDKAMKTVEYFTMRDWDMRNKKFQSLSKDLNPLEEEMFCMDLKDFTMDEITRIVHTGAEFYRMNGKPYVEKFKWKYLRYVMTFLFLSFYLGSFGLVFHLVFSKLW